MPRATSEAVAALLLACVALPLLLLALAWRTVQRACQWPVRTVITPAPPAPPMSDPFSDCPPQPVVFTCRKEGCSLAHEREVNRFKTVEQTVAYYCRQGHQAQAVFPAADDATWPPEDTTTEWHEDE